MWEAADLMQQMKKEGVKPDIHTYTSFISACSKAGDMNVSFFSASRSRTLLSMFLRVLLSLENV